MNEGKENGDAGKDVSDSVDVEMVEMVGDEGKDEKMSEERVIEEDEENDQTAIKDLQSKQRAVDDAKNGEEEGPECEDNDDNDNEKEDDLKDSELISVDMQSKKPVLDKSVDHDMEGDGKNPERNEEISGGLRDGTKDVTVKCENGVGRDAVIGGSSAADVENPAAEVNVGENTTDSKILMMEKIHDVSMVIESTPRTQTIMFDDALDGNESGTEEEQSAFIRDLESLLREKNSEFKVPKFYGVPVNLLKLWRSVIKLGGYDKVTACKLWRQVGESFNPPKTCTTVSFTFRIFYEKALLEYERHKIMGGEIDIPATVTEPVSTGSPSSRQIAINIQASGSGRARRDAASRAMQGWHSHRLLGNGEASDPVIKDKGSNPLRSREKNLKNIVGQKQKKPMVEPVVKVSRSKLIKGPSDTAVPVVDVGPAADWVKINVRTTKDCYEVYALVPGLLREEVRVQSDPAGRLVISGEPEHPDNPWGVTPFRKVVSLPSRIDPHQTSAVVTLHGQLFVRVPFEQSD